ncbi:hypothetical protein COLO4_38290 [Corchorus olitorius]|uniref:Uncharacterized protein n=1 Tax=Corchorus olitorius TaxID=93759 RepID=A0A1R3FVS3_9ROSI|nr:hypothetical protein COLO4_38290 [Corchorus olitorius]
MANIQERSGYPTFYDLSQIHFTNNIMAYYRRSARHTTRLVLTRTDDEQVVPLHPDYPDECFIPINFDASYDSDDEILPDFKEPDHPQQFR